MRCSTVYACAGLLADTLATSTCKLYRKHGNGEREQMAGHPADVAVRQKPNDYQTPYDFMRQMMLCLSMRGNHYAQIARTGKSISLYPHDSNSVTLKVINKESFYEVKKDGGGMETYSSADILHNKAIGSTGRLGMGCIEQCRTSWQIALYAEKHGEKLMTNGARPGAMVTHPSALSADAKDRLVNSILEQTTGDKAYSLLVLEEGMKYDQMAMSSVDMQFLENRKFQRNEICSLFRVAPHLIGDLERTTFSNIEHQSMGFINWTMLPWGTNIAQRFSSSLLTQQEIDNGFYFEFSFNHLLKGDTPSRFSTYQIGLLNGIYSPNEIRAKENDSPRPGGDEYRVPANTFPSSPNPDGVK